ncbi:MAG: hypothetical protein KIG60_04965 [Caryophanon sp.]|nr:hypothetical protein [Caryophanon sp.]
MKKIWLFSAAAAVMLAACNDTENVTPAPEKEVVEETAVAEAQEPAETPTTSTPQTAVETSETTEAAEPAVDPIEEADAETVDVEEEPVHEADAETVDDESSAAIEPSGEISYVQNNETYSAPTNFTTSGEQPFGLEVMDGFSLVAEEPGKDQLMFKDNSAITMAIETFTIGELTYDDLFTQAMEKAAALGEASPIEELPASDNITNIAAFEVDINGEKVVVMALETPSILAQFTMMDTAERSYIDAMMQMAVTIQGQ